MVESSRPRSSQVLEQRRQGGVEHRDLLPAGDEVLAVPVPVAEVEVDDRHAGLDQPPGQQEVLRVAGRIARLGRLVAACSAPCVLGSSFDRSMASRSFGERSMLKAVC